MGPKTTAAVLQLVCCVAVVCVFLVRQAMRWAQKHIYLTTRTSSRIGDFFLLDVRVGLLLSRNTLSRKISLSTVKEDRVGLK